MRVIQIYMLLKTWQEKLYFVSICTLSVLFNTGNISKNEAIKKFLLDKYLYFPVVYTRLRGRGGILTTYRLPPTQQNKQKFVHPVKLFT